MSTDTLRQLASTLAGITAPGRFATHFLQPAKGLHIEVEGLGEVPLPIDPLVARTLCESAELALHGYRDETRLDTRVRNTWEIPAHRIRMESATWQPVLQGALQRIHKDLGLPASGVLHADLHNLLVYEPGQFFARHQDSEKSDGMLATLVLSLPSKFTGGRFVIEHQGNSLRVGGSANQLGFTAFFADCAHEAQAVKSGYRVVLTYNLRLVAGEAGAAPNTQDAAVKPLSRDLRRYFETLVPARWDWDQPSAPPDRLVYLLDHQYTQRGLDWALLKNADAPRVAALREAAEALDCECILALADVHEVWSCEGGRARSRWSDDDYDDDDGSDHDPSLSYDMRLGELIDDDIELRHGLAADGSEADVMGARVDSRELCLTRASRECEPFQSEYEGFMGNYGNTLDRWYHRAAVVIWPRARAFELRARTSPLWALQQVDAGLVAEGADAAVNLAERVIPFWKQLPTDVPALGALALSVARRLEHAGLALDLLGPLQPACIPASAADDFAGLLRCYGLRWCEDLLALWRGERGWRRAGIEQQRVWIADALPAFCSVCCAAEPRQGRRLAESMLAEQWVWLQQCLRGDLRPERVPARDRAQRVQGFCAPLFGVMEAGAIVGTPEILRAIEDLLTREEVALSPEALVLLLREALKDAARARRVQGRLRTLLNHAKQLLEQRLAQAERVADDWSIHAALGCTCRECEVFQQFLAAPAERTRTWPLATQGREHIERAVAHHDLPVTCTTLRKGSPYKLVLEKSPALFQREVLDRQRWARDLAWLKDVARQLD